MNQLSQPIRRLIALALLAALPLLVFDVVVSPLWSRYDAATQAVRRLETVLARATVVQRQLAALTRQAAALQRRPAGDGALLHGDNPALVGARLQNQLKRLVDSLHGELMSTQILPPLDHGRFRRVAIRANLRIGVPGLQRLIYDLESQTPFLFVDNLRVRAPPPDLSAAPSLAAAGAAEGRVVVLLDVYGYVEAPKLARAS
ncbi:MAG: type II secretion system protein M [Rhodospirillales bacterium]|nr:type II secretion system protein M [Rhodospirillales bacterium]